jgi:hypothetical protein
MAKGTGPIAVVENKSGSVSKTQPIPANVGTPAVPHKLAAPRAERASEGHTIKNAGLAFKADSRHQTGGVPLETGFKSKTMGAPGKKSILDKASAHASDR